MSERASFRPNITPKHEDLGKFDKVLYGAWDATSGFIKNQMPQAHTERIIGVINKKIIPKLTDEQKMWVAKNHVAIETGARIAGIAVSAAEFYAVLAIVGLGERRIRQMINLGRYEGDVRKILNKDPWFQQLFTAYNKTPNPTKKGFAVMGGTILFLASVLHRERESQENVLRGKPDGGTTNNRRLLLRITGPKHAENTLKTLYMASFEAEDAYRQGLYGKNPRQRDAVIRDAEESFAAWKATNFEAAEGLLASAGVIDHRTYDAVRRLQGRQRAAEPNVEYVNMRPVTVVRDSGDVVIGVEANMIDLNQVALDEVRKGKKKKQDFSGQDHRRNNYTMSALAKMHKRKNS